MRARGQDALASAGLEGWPAEVDRQSRWGGQWIRGFDPARDGEGRVDDEPARPDGSLASLLEESLPGGQVDAEARNRSLGLGQEMTASAVAAVVGGTRRHAYELVARLVVGHAEALATAGGWEQPGSSSSTTC